MLAESHHPPSILIWNHRLIWEQPKVSNALDQRSDSLCTFVVLILRWDRTDVARIVRRPGTPIKKEGYGNGGDHNLKRNRKSGKELITRGEEGEDAEAVEEGIIGVDEFLFAQIR